MTGFGVWLRKELMEIARTWRRFVLPILMVFIAVLAPVLAYITPELLRSVASNEPGVVIEMPDPVANDAVMQWAQSLSQIVLIAVVIIAAGTVSNDLRDGSGQLMLVKPLGRPAFILAKVVAQIIFVAIVLALGTLVCLVVTRLIFDEAPIENLIAVSSVWFVSVVMFVAVMTLLSTLLRSQAAAAGAGLVVYLMLSIVGIWEPARDFSPAGLLAGLDELAGGGRPALALPVLTALIAGVAALWLAVARFQRMSLR